MLVKKNLGKRILLLFALIIGMGLSVQCDSYADITPTIESVQAELINEGPIDYGDCCTSLDPDGLGLGVTYKFKMKINGTKYWAYCIEPSKPSPVDENGDPIYVNGVPVIDDNPEAEEAAEMYEDIDTLNLTKVMYWGSEYIDSNSEGFFAGNPTYRNFTENERYLIVHLAAGYAFGYALGGEAEAENAIGEANETGIALAKECYEYCIAQPDPNSAALHPDTTASFSESVLRAQKDGDQQKTQTVKFIGRTSDPKQTAVFNLQENVQLHNVTTGVTSDPGAQGVKVNAGEEFYLTAPLTQEKLEGAIWDFTVDYNARDYSAYLVVPKSGNFQIIAAAFPVGIDITKKLNLEVRWIAREATLKTTATDQDTNGHEGLYTGQEKIKDKVEMTGLIPGKNYTLTGTLMDKATGQPLKDGSGNNITASETFNATAEEMTKTLTFTVDSREFKDDDVKAVVAFETLMRNTANYTGENVPVEAGKHEDINDEGQTIHYGQVFGTSTGDNKEIEAKPGAVVVDTVEYKGLVPGQAYYLEGQLYDKSEGKLTDIKANTIFTPEEADGTVDVTFNFDATDYAGHTMVAYEKLYVFKTAPPNGEKVYVDEHCDSEDEDQAVFVDSLINFSKKKLTGEDELTGATMQVLRKTSDGEVAVEQWVSTGTEKLLSLPDGEYIYRELSAPAGYDIAPDIEFSLVSQVLFDNSRSMKTHSIKTKESVDHGQVQSGDTITMRNAPVTVGTTATDVTTGTHDGTYSTEEQIKDTVAVSGLYPGRAYKITGKLMDKATNQPLKDKNNNEITAEHSFVANAETANVELTFTVDSSLFKAGKSVVAFEKLFRTTPVYESEVIPEGGKEIGSHEDINDGGQTITYKNGGIAQTVALNPNTDTLHGEKNVVAGKNAEIEDTVKYQGLSTGQEYVIEGVLYDKTAGELTNITARSDKFTPSSPNGSIVVTFKFDATPYEGHAMVVYETLKTVEGTEETVISEHKNPNDADQTTKVDKLIKVSKQSVTGDSELPGATLQILTKDGEEETLIKEWVSTEEQKEFSLPDGDYILREITAPYGYEVAEDAAFTVKDQMVSNTVVMKDKPVNVGTTATDVETGTHVGTFSAQEKIKDVVQVSGLYAGRKYKVSGVLMDKETGEALKDKSGNEITASTTFTATADTASVELTFTVDSSQFKVGKSVVAFEKLFRTEAVHEEEEIPAGGKELGKHEDINDGGQTVTYKSGGIAQTVALNPDPDALDGEKNIVAGKNAVIEDTVKYQGLSTGQEYVIEGVLYDKTDKKLTNITARSDKFTPTSANGSIVVTFTFDATPYEGHAMVVYETLKAVDGTEETVISEHKNPDDADQTTKVDKLIKFSKQTITGDEELPGATLQIIKVEGQDKTVVKQWESTTEQKEFSLPDGDYILREITAPYGYEVAEDAPFTVEDQMASSTVVMKNKPVNVKTTATDVATDSHMGSFSTQEKIKDVVQVSGLYAGREYKVSGKLMDKETGKALKDKDGNEITASKTFTAKGETESVELTFTVDSSLFGTGKAVVVFEKLYRTTKLYETEVVPLEIGKHEDIEDEDQTIHYDGIVKTTAVNPNPNDVDGEKNIVAGPNAKIKDTVQYAGLIVGQEYVVEGVLYDKTAGKLTNITARGEKFKPTSPDGTVVVTFTFDGTDYAGHSMVVYETLKMITGSTETEVSKHENPNDEDQTTKVDKLVYVSKQAITGDKELPGATLQIIKVEGDTQTVIKSWESTTEQKEFSLPDGDYILREITAPYGYEVAEDAPFTVDDNTLTSNTVVMKDKPVTVGTTASDVTTGGHTGTLNTQEKIKDVVQVSGLYAGREYKVTGKLMDKETKQPLKDKNGNEITASATFTAEGETASVELTFTVDSSAFATGKTIVAFEKLYRTSKVYETEAVPVEIGKHEDINDEDQTIHYGGIAQTIAVNPNPDDLDGDKNIVAGPNAKIKDTVKYEGLIVGQEYVVEGVLYDKTAGKLTDIKARSDKFKPTAANGSVVVTFTFDGTDYEGHAMVVYETLKLVTETEEVDVSKHENPNDEDQTTKVDKLLYFSKQKITGDAELPGATLQIIKVEGQDKTVVKEWESTTEQKEFSLPDGNYILREITAPNGYDVAEDAPFTVKDNMASDTVVMKNKPVTVGTTASDVTTGGHAGTFKAQEQIKDVVQVSGLYAGRTYKVTGVLMDKETKQPLKDKNGKNITATKSFTAQGETASVELIFTVDSSQFAAGRAVVAFEKLYRTSPAYETEVIPEGGKEIGEHEDINDEDQTVEYGGIASTVAVDKEDKDKNLIVGKNVKVEDTVRYEGLSTDETYIVEGELYDKTAGKLTGITAQSEPFKPEKPNGTVVVTFTIPDTAPYAGHQLVAYETLKVIKKPGDEEVVVHEHKNPNDEDQTVDVQKLLDFSKKAITGSDELPGATLQVIEKTGSQETIVKEWESTNQTQKIALDDGAYILREITAPNGYDVAEDVPFTVDKNTVTSKPVTMYNAPVTVRTLATDKETESHSGTVSTNEKIIDTVTMTGLYPGRQYKVSGTLMDKASKQPLKDASGKNITAQTTFVADAAEMEIELEFTIDSTRLEPGTSLVVFEKLFRLSPAYETEVLPDAGKEIGSHEDINDGKQSIHYGAIVFTEALDRESGTHNILAGGNVTITDKVNYEGLTVGQTYIVEGELYDKTTGQLTGIKAQSGEFQPTSPNGTIEVHFTFDAEGLQSHTLVVFERLLSVDSNKVKTEIYVHDNPNNEDETVYIPQIRTNALDGRTGDHIAYAGDSITITDRVTYSNLTPGEEYTVKGVLMDKSTGEELKVNGKSVTAEAKFTPTSANGYVDLDFTFDGRSFKGKSVVAFETLYLNGKVVGEHKDIHDEDQTVRIPKIQTEAGNKHGDYVIDTVKYTNLIPGRTYTVRGWFVDKSTGSKVSGSDGELTFVPDKPNGTVKVKLYPKNSKNKLVAFEEVYLTDGSDEKLVGEHKDINDKAQTYNPKTGKGGSKTGDKAGVLFGWLALIIASLGGIFVCYRRFRLA